MALRAWSSARFTIALPEAHRFPIAKYAMIRDAVLRSGVLGHGRVEEPDRVERWALQLAHTTRYVEAVMTGGLSAAEIRRLGLPWGEDLRERSLHSVQGTIEAARDALADGAGVNLAGGTHHAFADRGEGFCVFNDVAVAIRVLQREGRIRRVAVVDLDVHQGNGTAAILADDPDVFTFSMHGRKNFPFHKERSRLDVDIEDGCPDSTYLDLLGRHLGPVLDEARADLVFYLAGADPFLGDRFGRLGLTREGLRSRDRVVLSACRRRNLPVVLTLAGGYASNIADVVTIHLNTLHELRDACT